MPQTKVGAGIRFVERRNHPQVLDGLLESVQNHLIVLQRFAAVQATVILGAQRMKPSNFNGSTLGGIRK
jgi:hypothetical protein